MSEHAKRFPQVPVGRRSGDITRETIKARAVADAGRDESRLRRVQLDVTIVNTALHAIGSSLARRAELQWWSAPIPSPLAAFILTAGALGDRIGAKRIFMAGFALLRRLLSAARWR